MIRSLYVVGPAGVGKSTFMTMLLDQSGLAVADLEEFWSKRNAKALVTLRGHRMFGPLGDQVGVYLGSLREGDFPGTDALDRATSPTAKDWLENAPDIPRTIVAEGATLATRPFLYELQDRTDLMFVYLRCEPEEHEKRLSRRGAGQPTAFIRNTVTRSENLFSDLEQRAERHGYDTKMIIGDTTEDWSTELVLETALDHLGWRYAALA